MSSVAVALYFLWWPEVDEEGIMLSVDVAEKKPKEQQNGISNYIGQWYIFLSKYPPKIHMYIKFQIGLKWYEYLLPLHAILIF